MSETRGNGDRGKKKKSKFRRAKLGAGERASGPDLQPGVAEGDDARGAPPRGAGGRRIGAPAAAAAHPFLPVFSRKKALDFLPGSSSSATLDGGRACRAGRGAAGSTGGECCGTSCSHCPVGPTTLARLAGRRVVPRVPLTCLTFRLPVFSRHGLNSFDWEFFYSFQGLNHPTGRKLPESSPSYSQPRPSAPLPGGAWSMSGEHG